MASSALDLLTTAWRYSLDALPLPCWIHRRGIVRYTNPAFDRLTGQPGADSVPGRRVADLIKRRASTPVAFPEPETFVGGLETVGRRQPAIITTGDRRIDVEITSTLVTFEGEVMVLNLLRDVTQERKEVSGLRKAARRFRSLMDNSVIGVVEVNRTRIVDANDAFLKLVGRTREELERRELRWLEMTPPELRPAERAFVAKLEAGIGSRPVPLEFYRPDGSRVPVLLICVDVIKEPVIRALCCVIDLTEQKKTAEPAPERQRMDGVMTLAAGLAHSLNNLLTMIIGGAGLLLEDKTIAANESPREMLSNIITTGQEVAKMAAQLLAYSGQGRFVVSRTDIRELVEAHLAQIRSTLPEGVQLKTEVAANLPRVSGDPTQLASIVEALVKNATESVLAKGHGEVKVAVRSEFVPDGVLRGRSGTPLRAGRYCLVEVSDTGVGMDATVQAHAFEPFFTTKARGRGLGLAAVEGIVNVCGGTIQVDSQVGQGAVFRLYLPTSS